MWYHTSEIMLSHDSKSISRQTTFYLWPCSNLRAPFVHILLLIYHLSLDIYETFHPAAAAKSLQSCLTLCDLIDGSPSGSPIPGILQARTLEWVAISVSSAWKWKGKVKSLSRVRLFVTPWTAAHQAPPSMGFSRQEYWSGVPLPSFILNMAQIKLAIHILP